MTSKTPAVQYNHSIVYNGANEFLKSKDGANNRMTLRIEHISPLKFLVTKAVCSHKDQFTKKVARDLCDQRAMIHKSCIENSKKYHTDTIHIEYSPEVALTIQCWSHDLSITKDIAYVIEFSQDPDPRTYHSIIFDIFRLGSFTYL